LEDEELLDEEDELDELDEVEMLLFFGTLVKLSFFIGD
jgi:hypothetical protein